jgi:glycosyltransferase involved in cell wall biosynthesis
MLSLPLVVIGTGAEEKRLRAHAGPTVTFKGSLTDQELVSYYKRCKALLFPGKEDFGLTMAEAQTFGKPVIAFDGGGAREIVVDGKTGLLFGEQSVAGLKNALMQFEALSFDDRTIKQNAKRFSFELFKASFMREIEQILAKQ